MENLTNDPDNSNDMNGSVASKRRRRRFSRKQKFALIAEADRCTGVADLAALLQREGVFSSHLTVWRKQMSKQLAKQIGQQPGRRADARPMLAPRDPAIDRLELENAKLQRELMAANNVIELQRSSLPLPVHEYLARADSGK